MIWQTNILTLSLRADGSSYLEKKKDGVSIFPSTQSSMEIKRKKVYENINFINDVKVRLGVGKTGQQDITGNVGFYHQLHCLQSVVIVSHLDNSNLILCN